MNRIKNSKLNIAKLDYWPVFLFYSNDRVKEYLTINYLKRNKLNMIAHCKLNDILNFNSTR